MQELGNSGMGCYKNLLKPIAGGLASTYRMVQLQLILLLGGHLDIYNRLWTVDDGFKKKKVILHLAYLTQSRKIIFKKSSIQLLSK